MVIADSCQRVFVYGMKLLWNIENRNAVCFWVAALSKAAAPAKPSPSRQYAQRKLHEDNKKDDAAETNQDDDACQTHQDDGAKIQQDDEAESHRDDGAETCQDEGAETHKDEVSTSLNTNSISDSPSSQAAKNPELPSSPPHLDNADNLPSSMCHKLQEINMQVVK